jgi:hypothetical protein
MFETTLNVYVDEGNMTPLISIPKNIVRITPCTPYTRNTVFQESLKESDPLQSLLELPYNQTPALKTDAPSFSNKK